MFKSMTGYGFSGAYYYNIGDVRHKGGLTSVQMMAHPHRWKQCSVCKGYFLKARIDDICRGCKTWLKLKEITNE